MRPCLLLAPLALLAAGCLEQPDPEREVLGTYQFRATVRDVRCDGGQLTATVDAGLDFTATVARLRDGGQGLVVLASGTRDAGLDGPYVRSVHREARTYARCGSLTNVALEQQETLDLVLLTAAQGALPCGPDALDAGVARGGETPVGAPRACGELVDLVPGADGGEGCGECRVTFAVDGRSGP